MRHEQGGGELAMNLHGCPGMHANTPLPTLAGQNGTRVDSPAACHFKKQVAIEEILRT